MFRLNQTSPTNSVGDSPINRLWVTLALATALCCGPAYANVAPNTTKPTSKPATAASLPVGPAAAADAVTNTNADNLDALEQQRVENEAAKKAEAATVRTLSLADAEMLALQNDRGLQAQHFSALAVHERIDQSILSIYPTLSFSAGLTESGTISSSSGTIVQNQGTIVVDSKDIGDTTRSRLTGTMTLRQTLVDLARRPQLRQAQLNEAAALASLESTRQDVICKVRTAYFTAYIDQTMVDIRLQDVENKKLRLQQAEGHYKAGSKARIDVATAESDLAQAQLAAIRAQTQLQLDWVNLSVAMGVASNTPCRLMADPYWDRIPALDQDELTTCALANRSELLDMQARLRAQLAQLDIIETSNKPSLDATASLGGSGEWTPFDGTWSIGVTLNWTLFDGYLSKYQRNESLAQAQSALRNFEGQQITVYQEVCQAYVVLQQATVKLDAAEVAVASAQESYRLASARYRVGVGQSIEVSDAELSLLLAKMEAANAANEIRLAKAALIRAVGIDDIDTLPQENTPILPDSPPEK